MSVAEYSFLEIFKDLNPTEFDQLYLEHYLYELCIFSNINYHIVGAGTGVVLFDVCDVLCQLDIKPPAHIFEDYSDDELALIFSRSDFEAIDIMANLQGRETPKGTEIPIRIACNRSVEDRFLLNIVSKSFAEPCFNLSSSVSNLNSSILRYIEDDIGSTNTGTTRMKQEQLNKLDEIIIKNGVRMSRRRCLMLSMIELYLYRDDLFALYKLYQQPMEELPELEINRLNVHSAMSFTGSTESYVLKCTDGSILCMNWDVDPTKRKCFVIYEDGSKKMVMEKGMSSTFNAVEFDSRIENDFESKYGV